MSHDAPQHSEQQSHHHHGHHHEVEVRLNGKEKRIPSGEYLVKDLKTRLGVPPDYQLDEVVCGEFRPLKDDEHIYIKGGEEFISHVCRGGSA